MFTLLKDYLEIKKRDIKMQNEEQKERWLKERLKYVGASEISTVIKSECTEEEIRQAMSGSADEFIKDKLFMSPFGLYNYKKGKALPSKFPESLSLFGHEMEKFVAKYINFKCGDYLEATCQPQELIKCPEFHKLASYTPDIFIKLKKDYEFNSETLIKRLGNPIFAKKDEQSVCEAKTTNLFKFKQNNWGVDEENQEVMFKYINQNQYQNVIQNKIDNSFKYGIIGCAVPYEKDFDNDFYKGRAVELCQNLTQKNFEKLCGWYDIKLWIYPIFETLKTLFISSLNRWEERLQNCSEPKPNYENDKDTKLNKQKMSQHMEEFLIECQKKFGIENKGIIEMTPELQQKYPNLSDELKIDKQNREDKLHAEKAIKKNEAKFIDIFFKERIFGYNFDNFTAHVKRHGKGLRFMNNFKTTNETTRGKAKISKDIDYDVSMFV